MRMLLPLVALISTLAFVLAGSASVIRAAVHSWSLPMCWRCGADKVRRSGSYGRIDLLVKCLYLVPYRCRGCRARFYGLRASGPFARWAVSAANRVRIRRCSMNGM
jgi:hypothetical protein